MQRLTYLGLLPLLLAGCEEDTFPSYIDAGGVIDARFIDSTPRIDGTPGPDAANGEHYQYILQTFHYPASTGEVTSYGQNLDCATDGEGHDCLTSNVDNQFGEILNNFRTLGGLDAQTAMDAAIAAGQIIQLFDIDDEAIAADFSRVWVGSDSDGNPADNFSGVEEFTVSGPVSFLPTTFDGTHVAAGCRPDGDVQFDISPLRFKIRLALISGRPPIELDVLGTFSGTYGSAGIIDGILAGGIPTDQVTSVLIPELYVFVNDLLTRAECDSTCVIRRAAHLAFWDTNDDGAVPLEEFAANTIFSLDLDLLDDSTPTRLYDPWTNDGTVDHLSFGFGFSATTAVFTTP